MTFTTILGFFATALGTVSLLPQVIFSWKNKRTKGVSLPTYILLVSAFSLWIIYGLLIGDFPIVIANTSGVIFSGTLIYLKRRYG